MIVRHKFSLIEMICSIALLSIIIGVTSHFFGDTLGVYRKVDKKIDQLSKLDLVLNIIRQKASIANEVVIDQDGLHIIINGQDDYYLNFKITKGLNFKYKILESIIQIDSYLGNSKTPDRFYISIGKINEQ